MYAVIRTGGKQYRVTEGDVLRVEKLSGEPGATVEFDEVLMVGEGKDVSIGKPVVSGSTVKAKILGAGRGRKVEIIKFKRRKHHMKRQGHRQNYTEVEITGITGGQGGGSSKAKAASESTDKPAAKKAASSTSKPAASKSASEKKPAAKKSASTAKKSASTTKKASTAKKSTAAKKPAAKQFEKKDDSK